MRKLKMDINNILFPCMSMWGFMIAAAFIVKAVATRRLQMVSNKETQILLRDRLRIIQMERKYKEVV